MGSGVLLAILVGLWFVVLVPMVVTRGEVSAAPSESRVLRRRSDLRTDRIRTADSPVDADAESSGAAAMPTEPIPRLPSTPPLAATATTSKSVAPKAAAPKPAAPKPAAPKPAVATSRTGSQSSATSSPSTKAAATGSVPPRASIDAPSRGEIDIRARRRRMLVGLVALAVLWAGFALLWQPVLWWVQVVVDLVVFGYVVFLRLEAQREQDRQERRRARTQTRVRLPEDRVERSVRVRTEYQSQVATASRNDQTNSRAIALDDDDPNLAQMPMWDPNQSSVTAMRERDNRADWLDREAV